VNPCGEEDYSELIFEKVWEIDTYEICHDLISSDTYGKGAAFYDHFLYVPLNCYIHDDEYKGYMLKIDVDTGEIVEKLGAPIVYSGVVSPPAINSKGDVYYQRASFSLFKGDGQLQSCGGYGPEKKCHRCVLFTTGPAPVIDFNDVVYAKLYCYAKCTPDYEGSSDSEYLINFSACDYDSLWEKMRREEDYGDYIYNESISPGRKITITPDNLVRVNHMKGYRCKKNDEYTPVYDRYAYLNEKAEIIKEVPSEPPGTIYWYGYYAPGKMIARDNKGYKKLYGISEDMELLWVREIEDWVTGYYLVNGRGNPIVFRGRYENGIDTYYMIELDGCGNILREVRLPDNKSMTANPIYLSDGSVMLFVEDKKGYGNCTQGILIYDKDFRLTGQMEYDMNKECVDSFVGNGFYPIIPRCGELYIIWYMARKIIKYRINNVTVGRSIWPMEGGDPRNTGRVQKW